MRTFLRLFFPLYLFLGIFAIYINSSYAQTSSNPDYTVEHQELEQKAYHPQEKKQNDPRIIVGKNYQAILGFGDIPEKSFFSIKISGTILDFGKLYPTNPILREVLLEVDGKSSHGYSVLAYEDHPLADSSFANIIPNTSCDRGLCTQLTSGKWEDNLTYGFGYTCEDVVGVSCSDFENSNSYKSFADASKSENHQPVLSTIESGRTKTKLIHKLNVSASQKNKIYLNNINYLAIPNF